MEHRAGVPDSPQTDGGSDATQIVGDDDVIAVALSFEEYEEIERRRKRKLAVLTWCGVVLATIALPIAYLLFIGQFSTAHLLRSNEVSRSAALHGPRRISGAEPSVYGVMTQPKRSPAEQREFDSLKNDVSDYVNHGLKGISPEEKMAIIGFGNVTGRNFRDNATTMAALRTDVIPAQQKLVMEAEALHPKTKEVRTVNALLLRSAKMRLVAYMQMLSGENDPDGLWKYAFDADLKDAEENARAYHIQLTQLAEQADVRLPR